MATAIATDQDLIDEIQQLKLKYGKDCRIIENIGDFAYVVQVALPKWNVTVKFQVSDGYPSTRANIIISGIVVPDEKAEELSSRVINTKEFGQMEEYLDIFCSWLSEQELHSSVESPQSARCKKQRNKTRGAIAEEVKVEKKSSMKTAEDVISRIIWDGSLSPSDFIVGYLDRFLGIVEKNFATFSWEDIASVDYTVLAIPKHRIQYFKYKKVTVWDKKNRTDNVFGSTGSGITIADVIESYVENCKDESALNEGDDDNARSDSDSDDDDIVVAINCDKQEYGTDHVVSWQDKRKPNYFLCMRITAPEIVENVSIMQNKLLSSHPKYAKSCIKPTILHMTFCTLGLHTPAQLNSMIEILHKYKDELSDLAKKEIRVTVNGVGNFFERVVYGKVEHGKDFTEFIDHLRILVREAGVETLDAYDFVPHITILKITPPTYKAVGCKTVPACFHEDYKDMFFGTQIVRDVCLCAISKDRDGQGFYACPVKLDLLETFDDDNDVVDSN